MGFLVLLAPFAILAVVVAAKHLAHAARVHRQLSAELSGDWWRRFEDDFRTYASRTWKAAREAERRL